MHNRITGLERIAGELRKLVPGISIRIAHGRMSEEMLEDAMIDFYEGNCDLLLSTTIIENGLDVPLANTIIIDGAENFGLSQLYQMRQGRPFGAPGVRLFCIPAQQAAQ